MKHIAILCGGESYEHEVSIITGLQVAETIDQSKFTFSFVYFAKDNRPFLIPNLKSRKDFYTAKRVPMSFVKTERGVELVVDRWFGKRIEVEAAYLAFHGGTGEAGAAQGLCELLALPFTSASSEGSAIAMNKTLTKQVLKDAGIPILKSLSIFSKDYQNDPAPVLKQIKEAINFPCILKPVHLGSSIGIEIAHNEVELEKFLNVATRVDGEVMIEPALENFTEYNISLRSNGGKIEFSPIEEPIKAEDILSFADKYANGSKKTGGKTGKKSGGGMELLDRTLPADISQSLKTEIENTATAVYKATRLSGLVRIDFLYHEDKLYCSEINPIPGSMAFYLWEAKGEQFQEQITHALEDAITRIEAKVEVVPYETDIVKKFVGN